MKGVHAIAPNEIQKSFSSCIMEFNSIFQYSLLSFFLWDMLAASSMLVTIQFELVEYKFLMRVN